MANSVPDTHMQISTLSTVPPPLLLRVVLLLVLEVAVIITGFVDVAVQEH
jgi:hypothetical protein